MLCSAAEGGHAPVFRPTKPTFNTSSSVHPVIAPHINYSWTDTTLSWESTSIKGFAGQNEEPFSAPFSSHPPIHRIKSTFLLGLFLSAEGWEESHDPDSCENKSRLTDIRISPCWGQLWLQPEKSFSTGAILLVCYNPGIPKKISVQSRKCTQSSGCKRALTEFWHSLKHMAHLLKKHSHPQLSCCRVN